MSLPSNMVRNFFLLIAIVLPAPFAVSQPAMDLGLRGGASLPGVANNFYQLEVFARPELPWHWDFCRDWRLQSGLDTSGGDLSRVHANAFIATLGPMLSLQKAGFPLVLSGGSSATVLTRHVFGDINFGDDFQFTSHVEIDWRLGKRFSLGYRFQHMSNAGIAQPNPGLNVQMLEASYFF